MSSSLHRDVSAGGIAGLIAGLTVALAMNAQGMATEATGLLGLSPSGTGLVPHLMASALVGAAFCAILRYQPQSYAATLSTGLLFGLLLWIVGPLTLPPLLEGEGPTWSAVEAGHTFPSLLGHLLYGGMIGLGFHILVTLYLRLNPEAEPAEVSALAPSKHVLILGGGYAGVATAQALEKIFVRDPSLEIVLVSHSNFLVHTPMLADVASSALEAQHISAPLRASCPRTHVVRASVKAIDTDAREVHIQASPYAPVETVSYEHLVLALGAVPAFYDLPGLEANSFTLKTLQDAIRLRNHIISMLEQADAEADLEERRRLLTFVVAGGGFAGTEMIASLLDMIHSILRYYPEIPPDELRFVVVHSRDRILPELSPELADYSQRKLEARGIEFKLGVHVAGAAPDEVLLKDGSRITARTLIWTAGNQPNPLVRTLPGELDRRGAVVTDNTMQVKGLTNVWAVGDCAAIPDVNNQGNPCPPTAQHALREGQVVAKNIAAVLKGKSPRPFRFRTRGLLVALGQRTAGAEIRGFRFSGLLAWFMWRTLYWSKLPGLEKKVRVAIDWTVELFFPRDIVLTMDLERR